MKRDHTELLAAFMVIFLIGVSAYMAITGIDGWGWFLFAGLLCTAGL